MSRLGEYYARPLDTSTSQTTYEQLDEHLSRVQNNIYSLRTPTPQIVRRTLAYAHDFGKLTSWFQEYIKTAGNENEHYNGPNNLKEHALISAYVGMHAVDQLQLEEDFQTAVFMAIAKHHGVLPNIENGIRKYTSVRKANPDASASNRLEKVETQIRNIHENARVAANELLSTIDDQLSWTDFVRWFNKGRQFTILEDYTVTRETYERMVRLYSELTYADKTASARVSAEDSEEITSSAVDAYVNELGGNEATELNKQLNSKRQSAYDAVVSNLDSFDSAATNVATLSLPTGFGKTLSGLRAATDLAERKGGNIVYALPFTSIIDQTDEVVREVFDVDPSSSAYTIHHHMAETRTISDKSENATYDAQTLLAETWAAELTLTTFVQLLESLAGPTNSQSLKLPSLQNAVIILDEPQAISHEWWELTTRLIGMLTEKFNATVILMTATEPKIVRKLSDTNPYPLVKNTSHYVSLLDDHPRVEYRLHPSVMQYIDGASGNVEIREGAKEIAENNQDTLAVCNTIASALELGTEVSSLVNGASLNRELGNLTTQLSERTVEAAATELVQSTDADSVVVTLTTRLRPLDRKILIEAMKKLLESDEGPTLYAVSTQLIEAGVDISFERLYRDIAPLSSIVQAAGRCNRAFEGKTSEVTIWRLQSGNGSIPSSLVYKRDYNLLRPTRETLKKLTDTDTIKESTMVRDGPDVYYDVLHKRSSPGDTNLREAVDEARFADLRRESLIQQTYPTVDIIIALNADERAIVQTIQRYQRLGRWERANRLQRVLNQRTVSVPLSDDALDSMTLEPLDEENGVYALDGTQYSGQYDFVEGPTEATVEDRFLM